MSEAPPPGQDPPGDPFTQRAVVVLCTLGGLWLVAIGLMVWGEPSHKPIPPHIGMVGSGTAVIVAGIVYEVRRRRAAKRAKNGHGSSERR